MANKNDIQTNPETVAAFPIHKFMAVLSELLSEQYGCKITMRAIPRDQVAQQPEEKPETIEQKEI